MKGIKRLFFGFIIFLASWQFCSAETPDSHPRHSWDLGTEVYHFQYEEPGVMKDKGLFYGLKTSYQYFNNYQMYKIEARLASGSVDYESKDTGNIDNIDDYAFELRGLIGYDVINPSYNFYQIDLSVVPYTGLAYRYLNDDTSGKVSSTGAVGYERESNYIYTPIGVEVTRYYGFERNVWSIGATAEFDVFWWGRQISHLSDAGLGYSDVRNDQESGFGLRGSIKFARKSEGFDFVLEPFIRYWHIGKSEVRDVYKAGVLWGYGWEPKNETTEIGVNFSIKF